jgi:hypothetical protein
VDDETGFTLEDRVLCSDDACVGTVGPDRRCKVCGKPYEGDEDPAASAASPAPHPSPDASSAPTPAADPDASPDERVCCPDDACVGVIGPDGTCGVCGKSA